MDMDAFFASVEIASRPYLLGKPVAVGGSSNKRTVVAAASYPAREYGIHAGMASAEAFARCPNIIMIEPDMDKYASVSASAFRIIEQTAGNVEIYSIDEGFACINGSLHEAEQTAAMIKARIRNELHVTCSIGIAENKLIAKIASDDNKPDGLTAVPDGRTYIGSKPVQDVPGIGRKTRAALNSMGIYKVEDIRPFPMDVLKRRFKSYAFVLKEISEGSDRSHILWNLDNDIKSVGNTHTLNRDTDSSEELKAMLGIISEHIALRMRDAGMEGSVVCLVLRYSDFFTFSKRRKIYAYIKDPADIHAYACSIFDSIELAQKVRLIGISVSGLRPVSMQMTFPFNDDERMRHFNDTVLDIKDRFGEWAIMKASGLLMQRRGFMHFGGIDRRTADIHSG